MKHRIECCSDGIHRLYGSQAYLAGPMDRVNDRGRGWREKMAKFLSELHIGVLCPFNKPSLWEHLDETNEFYERLSRLKRDGDFDGLHDIMSQIVAEDYRMVDKCDFLILYINTNVHMCGSYFEAGLAAYQRKPIVICSENGVSDIPNWIFGIGIHQMFFDSWDKVKSYIKHVCFDEEVETYNRWRFFNFNKIYEDRNARIVGG